MAPSDGYAEPQRSSNNTVLYVILAIVLVVVLICGGIAFAIYRAITGAVDTFVELGHQATIEVIQDSDMDPDDKEKLVAQANRVAEAYKADEITLEQVSDVMQRVFEGPILMVGMCQHLERKYVVESELSEATKAEGQLTMQRLARGAHEQTISQFELQELFSSIQEYDEEGTESFKETLTDEELQEFLGQAKQLADDHNIPEEPHDIDIGEEVKKAVDEVLGTE